MFHNSLYRLAAQAALDAYSDQVASDTCIPIYALETDIHGFVRWDGQTVTVAIRGTKSLRNWFTDVQVAMIDIGGMRVHAGFWKAFQSIAAQVQNAVAQFPDGKLVVTAHSLGAALIKFIAAHLAKQGRIPDVVITFGEPRQGDKAWAKFYDSLLGDRTVRVVHECDIVPRVPMHWWLSLYRHTRNNLFFDAVGVAHYNLPVILRLSSDIFDLWNHFKMREHFGMEEPVQDHDMEKYWSLFPEDAPATAQAVSICAK